MKAETLLIDSPGKQSLPRRILYGALTVIAWLMWGLLWLPALHWVTDQLDMPWRYERWLPDIVLSSTRDLASLAWIPPLSLLVFAAWSFYESRHRRRERRRRRLPTHVPLPDAAESLGATTVDAERIQDTRRSVLRVDEEGHIDVAETGAADGYVHELDRGQRRQA